MMFSGLETKTQITGARGICKEYNYLIGGNSVIIVPPTMLTRDIIFALSEQPSCHLKKNNLLS